MSNKKVKTAVKKVTNNASKIAVNGKNFIAANPILILKGVGILAGVYFGYKLISNASNTVDNLFKPTNFDDTVDGAGQGDRTKATITNAQAINFASQLLDAMNWNFMLIGGTDNDTVSTIFDKIKNPSDFLLVYDAFGKKHHNGSGSPATGWADFIDLDMFIKHLDLVGWLKTELNSVTDKKLYNKVKSVVEQAGFTF